MLFQKEIQKEQEMSVALLRHAQTKTFGSRNRIDYQDTLLVFRL